MWTKTSNYIKLAWGAKEKIEGRIRIGFLRCPKCKSSFGIYKDEFRSDGKSIREIKHPPCGFRSMVELKEWEERSANNKYYR